MPNTTAKLTVKTETEFEISVNMKRVQFGANKKGSIQVPVGESCLLVWMMAGDPGATIEIQIAADPGLKVDTSKNPIKDNIPKRFFRGAGKARFKIQ